MLFPRPFGIRKVYWESLPHLNGGSFPGPPPINPPQKKFAKTPFRETHQPREKFFREPTLCPNFFSPEDIETRRFFFIKRGGNFSPQEQKRFSKSLRAYMRAKFLTRGFFFETPAAFLEEGPQNIGGPLTPRGGKAHAGKIKPPPKCTAPII